MMKRTSISLAAIALGTVAASASAAEPEAWTLTFSAGAHLLPRDKVQGRHSTEVLGVGTTLDTLRQHDIFDSGPAAGLELGYNLRSNLQTFLRIDYSQLSGNTVRIGDVRTPAAAAREIRARFDDANTWQANVGARFLPVDSGPWQPYLSAYIGVDRTDEWTARITVDGQPIQSGDGRLLPRETRFNAGVELGLGYDISDAAAVRLSVAGDYKAQREEDTRAYQALGFNSVRVSDQSWTIPVEVGISWKF
jgi:opacity protein-like surface antigen